MPDGDEIVLFFDGSKSLDATALIGCHIADGHVFAVGVWEPDPDHPESQVPVREVDAAVAMAFDRWTPVAFFADVREWEAFTQVTWPERYGDGCWCTRSRAAGPPARSRGTCARRTTTSPWRPRPAEAEIDERQFTHDGTRPWSRGTSRTPGAGRTGTA